MPPHLTVDVERSRLHPLWHYQEIEENSFNANPYGVWILTRLIPLVTTHAVFLFAETLAVICTLIPLARQRTETRMVESFELNMNSAWDRSKCMSAQIHRV